MKIMLIMIMALIVHSNADLISNGIAINSHTIITTSHGVYGTDSGKVLVDGKLVSLRLIAQYRDDENYIDIAFVSVPESINLTSCKIEPMIVDDSAKVILNGYLFNGTYMEQYKTNGYVVYDDMLDKYMYTINAASKQGLSGSPVIYNNHIIGMSAKINSDGTETYAYVSPLLLLYIDNERIVQEANTNDYKKCVYPIIGYTRNIGKH